MAEIAVNGVDGCAAQSPMTTHDQLPPFSFDALPDGFCTLPDQLDLNLNVGGTACEDSYQLDVIEEGKTQSGPFSFGKEDGEAKFSFLDGVSVSAPVSALKDDPTPQVIATLPDIDETTKRTTLSFDTDGEVIFEDGPVCKNQKMVADQNGGSKSDGKINCCQCGAESEDKESIAVHKFQYDQGVKKPMLSCKEGNVSNEIDEHIRYEYVEGELQKLKPKELTPAEILSYRVGREYIRAVQKGDLDLIRLSLSFGADVNFREPFFYRPGLFYAATNGRLDVVKLLVEHKADINDCDISNETPLFCSIHNHHQNVVQFLIDSSAHVNFSESTKSGFIPLIEAIKVGNCGTVELLLRNGANVNYISRHGETALKKAASRGDFNMVELLLKANARTDPSETPCPASALSLALIFGYTDVFKLLVQYKADVDHIGHRKETLLFQQARTNNVANIKLLLDSNADVFHKDAKGMTAFSIAVQHSHSTSICLLHNEKRKRIVNAIDDASENQLPEALLWMICDSLISFNPESHISEAFSELRSDGYLHSPVIFDDVYMTRFSSESLRIRTECVGDIAIDDTT